jgi:hypothetical protein
MANNGPAFDTMMGGFPFGGDYVIGKNVPGMFNKTTIIKGSPQPTRWQALARLGKQPQISTEENPRDEKMYPVIKFFDCHIRLSEGLNGLINQNISGHFSYSNIYDPISNIISEYDKNLAYLPDSILDIFFDYTNLLEGVLLVSKRRNVAVTDIKDILMKLSNCYSKVYSLMKSSDHNDSTLIAEELAQLKEEIGNRKLLPTVDECEQEMEETFKSMNDEEKKDLARLLRKD